MSSFQENLDQLHDRLARSCALEQRDAAAQINIGLTEEHLRVAYKRIEEMRVKMTFGAPIEPGRVVEVPSAVFLAQRGGMIEFSQPQDPTSFTATDMRDAQKRAEDEGRMTFTIDDLRRPGALSRLVRSADFGGCYAVWWPERWLPPLYAQDERGAPIRLVIPEHDAALQAKDAEIAALKAQIAAMGDEDDAGTKTDAATPKTPQQEARVNAERTIADLGKNYVPPPLMDSLEKALGQSRSDRAAAGAVTKAIRMMEPGLTGPAYLRR